MLVRVNLSFLGAILLFASCSSSHNGIGTRAEALEDAAWSESAWISVANAPVVTGTVRDGSRAADGANWFVSTLRNDRKVVSARWMATALGVFDLYVNGVRIGQEVLKPGFTHREKTKYSFTYDITEVLHRSAGAENVFAAQVTPGWWADKIVTPGGHDGMIGRKCAFRGVVELVFSDGTRQLYGTDTEHWKAGIAGPVKHAAIFDGETYDARELPGWSDPGKLSVPEVNTEFPGEILPSSGAEIYRREDLALSPVGAYVWQGVEGVDESHFGKVIVRREYAPGAQMRLSPGEILVIDFGQNCAAVPEFEFQATPGTVLSCLTSEILNDGNGARSRGMDGPEGSIHRLNLRVPNDAFRLDYIFGNERQMVTYSPRCTFFGYRYISLTADGGDVTLHSVRSIQISSVARTLETGSIVTGDESINRLIANTVWGMRSNYLSVPTDCPQRNERLGWTADTQVFAETGSFFANTAAFFHKWMRDMRDSQSEKGGFPGVAPTAQYGESMMRLGWADAGVIVPWTVWKQFADTSIINENWAAMERFMHHVAAVKYDHEALSSENGNYQWADWLSYEPLESHRHDAFRPGEGRVPLPEAVDYWNYLSACYWAIDAAMMQDMAAASGRDPQPYAEMLNEARNYLRTQFFRPDGTFKTDILNTMQTPALFALRCDLVEGPAREEMKERLRANFAAHEGCLQTGFLGTSILMQTLTENGMADVAWDLLFQRRNPSWLYSVDNGATTIWERWNSYTREHGMGPKGMNSFNHYAYGCVCEWLWETAAGIAADPAEPGFRHIIMRPVPDKRLGHLDAEFRSPAGLIKSSWKYEGDKWIWTFSIPEGAHASVTLPGENEAREYGPGVYTVSK